MGSEGSTYNQMQGRSEETAEFISDLLAREAQNSLIESLPSDIELPLFVRLYHSLYQTTPAFVYDPQKTVLLFTQLCSGGPKMQRDSLKAVLFGGFPSYGDYAQAVMINQRQSFKHELTCNRLVEKIKHRAKSQMTKYEFKEFLRTQFRKDANTRVVMAEDIFKSSSKHQFDQILIRLLGLEEQNEQNRGKNTAESEVSLLQQLLPDLKIDFNFKSPEQVFYEDQMNRKFQEKSLQAFQFYIPDALKEEEKQYIFKLEALLRGNKQFTDQNPPHCPYGQYLPAAKIFNGDFKLFSASSSVYVRDPNRIGLEREIEPKDVHQGKLGTCGCLSCFASCAEKCAESIQACFLFRVNPARYYVGKMYLHGRLKYIETDDSFPCLQGQPLSARAGGNKMWVSLGEKMLAKLLGSYDEIVGRRNSDIMRALTGAPMVRYSHLNVAQLTKELTKIDQNNFFATVLAKPKFMSEQLKVTEAKQHSFSYLRKYEQGSVTLVKLMNPWGTPSWRGDWSFQSQKWTLGLRTRLNYNQDPEDGSFFLSIEDFQLYFDGLVVCRIRNSYKHTSYSLPDCSRQKYFRTTISTPNIYALSIHLDSADQESYMRIIVMRETEDSLIYQHSRVSDPRSKCCDIQSQFKQGMYVIAVFLDCKINEKSFTLTSYGPEQIQIQAVTSLSKFQAEGIDKYFNRQLLKSYSQKMLQDDSLKKEHIHWKEVPEKVTIVYSEIKSHGLGFIKVENLGDKNGMYTWKANMKVQAMGGEEMNPLKVHVKAGKVEIRGYYFLKHIGKIYYNINWETE